VTTHEPYTAALAEAVTALLMRLAQLHPCHACGSAATMRGSLDGRPRMVCDWHSHTVRAPVDMGSAAPVRAAQRALASGGEA
jgi:hypothetical protein